MKKKGPDCMSRLHGEEDRDKNNSNNDEYDIDNEIGATISVCYIVSMSESLNGDRAVTMEETMRVGLKDTEYMALMDAIQGGLP